MKFEVKLTIWKWELTFSVCLWGRPIAERYIERKPPIPPKERHKEIDIGD